MNEPQLLGPGESRQTMDTITPEALHQLQVDRESAIADRDMYKHRAERWHARAKQLRAASNLPDMEPAPPAQPEPRTALAEHTEATLADLYDRLEDADSDVAEARQAAQAMYRAWNEQRTALTEGVTLAADVHNTLLLIRSKLSTGFRDWSQSSDDAWMYAVLYGWDCEQQHEHTDACPALLDEVATKHGWSAARVERVRKHRAVFAKVGPNGETEAAVRREMELD